MLLIERIDSLIAESMKSKDNQRLETLKLIKCDLVKKQKDGVTLTEAVEAQVLNKMIAQRKDSIEQFTKANRLDLVEAEASQLVIIQEFAPKEASEAEIIEATKEAITELKSKNGNIAMKDMKTILSMVCSKYPTANGKIVSSVLKSEI